MDIEVKLKNNQDIGVFAVREFKKGEIVLDWNPQNKHISKDEIDKLSEKEKAYVGVFQGGYVLIAEPGRYINHSCTPNIENRNGADYALRTIKSGEEILGNYEAGGTLVGFKCSCGAQNCRNSISSTVL